MLSDYPDTAKFLTPNERRFLQDRLLLDRDGCSHEYRVTFIKDAFLDWKVWFVSRISALRRPLAPPRPPQAAR
jgi:hypothetical protein